MKVRINNFVNSIILSFYHSDIHSLKIDLPRYPYRPSGTRQIRQQRLPGRQRPARLDPLDDLFDGIRTSEAMLADMIAQPDTTILLHRDETTGALLASVYLEKKGDLMYLGTSTVLPTAQARGLGKQMLREAEDYTRTLGCRTVEMTVITRRTELIAWYERRGYAIPTKSVPSP